ncbi:MAG TPA: F0F1 ATP synthase subunit delta [Chthoniobacterales bacterium]|nr:F0F1 ATP synthase subunit delta [Chthoniobacterales bacterium]
MKINKETRQLSKELLRASFVDGRLEGSRISSLVKSLIEKKPRHFIQVLEAYQRLIRLEVEKRTATIETATELSPEAGQQIVANLTRKYGNDLTARFVVTPELLGGMRIRVGSDVWDSSVRNRLQRLQQQL